MNRRGFLLSAGAGVAAASAESLTAPPRDSPSRSILVVTVEEQSETVWQAVFDALNSQPDDGDWNVRRLTWFDERNPRDVRNQVNSRSGPYDWIVIYPGASPGVEAQIRQFFEARTEPIALIQHVDGGGRNEIVLSWAPDCLEVRFDTPWRAQLYRQFSLAAQGREECSLDEIELAGYPLSVLFAKERQAISEVLATIFVKLLECDPPGITPGPLARIDSQFDSGRLVNVNVVKT